MRAAFAAARQVTAGAVVESSYRLAGRSVRLRVVGPALATHVCRPFAHLAAAVDPGTTRLHIDLWDEAVTGIPCPIVVREALANRPLITASADGRFVGYGDRHAATWLDRQTGHIVGWVASGERLSAHERTKPLLFQLSLWHADEGGQIVHAGLVARNSRGVLFAGRGGAGKSTAALACAEAGFGYLGDDCTALYPGDDGAFMGYSLYGSALLDPGHLACFPRLAPHTLAVAESVQGKAAVMLPEVAAVRLADGVPIHAVALPRITDRPLSATRPATRAEAFLALAPYSILVFSGQGPRAVKRLRALVEHVPAYWLPLGPDLREIPRLVADLLDSVTSS
jgi:hypothetical protein